MTDNELMRKVPGQLEDPQPTSLTQNGDNSTQIAFVNTYEDHSSKAFIITAPGSTNRVFEDGGLSHEYYNLIVTGDGDFRVLSEGSIVMSKDRVLTGMMADDVRERFGKLTPEIKKEILTFPLLIAHENTQYGRTDESQEAFFGYLKDIRQQTAGIRISFLLISAIPQQRLNEHLLEFDLIGDNRLNELNRTHWAIKNVDLVTELRKAGITVLAP